MNKTILKTVALFVVPCLLADTLAEPAFSIALVDRVMLNGWVANFNPLASREALKRFAGRLDELSVFGLGGNARGGVVSETDFIARSLKAVRWQSPRPRVLLTVANNRFRHVQDRWLLDQWIGSPERRMQHVQDLVKQAEAADGLDIDYENLRPSDAPAYEAFIQHLGQELHKKKKYLSVTVEHQTFTDGRIHWKTLSRDIDRVRIMAYHYHYHKTGAGAVSPPQVVQRLVMRALQVIPREKLEIALPMYGFDWTAPGHGRVIATLADYQRLTRIPGARVFRDPQTRSARITYKVAQGPRKNPHTAYHTVWFEDPTSVMYKMQLLKSLGVMHIGLWQIGAGDISPLFDSHALNS